MKYSQFTSSERIAKYKYLTKKKNSKIVLWWVVYYVGAWLVSALTYSRWSVYLKPSTNLLLDWKLYAAPLILPIGMILIVLVLAVLATSSDKPQLLPEERPGYDDGD